MKRLLRLMSIVLGCTLLGASCSKPVNNGAAENTETQEVKNTIEAFGIIKASDFKNITIDFPAVIEAIHVKNGQKVKMGDALFTLNISDFNSQIAAKEHEIAIAGVDGKKVENDYQGSKVNLGGQIQGLQNEVNKLNKDLKDRKDNLQNNTDLNLQRLSKLLENARNAYESDPDNQLLKDGVDEAAYNLESAKKVMQDDIDTLQASINQKSIQIQSLKKQQSSVETSRTNSAKSQKEKASSLEIQLMLLKDKLNKSYIKENQIISDIENGLVYDIGYVKGDAAVTGKKLLSIMNLDSLMVEANVSEEFIKDVALNAEVSIIPLKDKAKVYKGTVTRISDMAIQQNGETVIPIEISIENKDEFLTPESNVDVEISK